MKKGNTLSIPLPSMREVENYVNKWKYDENMENYRVQESVLKKLFAYPYDNKKLEDVLLKVTVLNSFYSTNIFAVYKVAKHIVSIKDIDKRLRKGDRSLVDEIKLVDMGDTTKSFYSFASKYCSHHEEEHFPIYDSLVCKALMHFQKKDKFSERKFTEKSLKDYKEFFRVLECFRTFYKLENVSTKELDWYLWLLGKEYFARNRKSNH